MGLYCDFFPTCQVRVVRFYINSRSFSSFSSSSSPDLNYDDHSRVFAAGPQPRPSTPSVRCRTSTTTSHAQCSLPDLNHDQPRPVFAAGPQPRPATPSVRCRGLLTANVLRISQKLPVPAFAGTRSSTLGSWMLSLTLACFAALSKTSAAFSM